MDAYAIGMPKPETRIIPEEVAPKFFAEHFKVYEFLKAKAAGKTVLEVGCGDGYGAAYLADTASEVTAVDYDDGVIAAARAKYSRANLKFISMEAGALCFEDNSFDIVCSFQVIEHIPEAAIGRYLSEIKRVLGPQGYFYLSTLNLEHAVKSPKTYKKNPAHCKEFVLTELQVLLSSEFPRVKIYGLFLTLKHHFYQRLKKIGLFNFLPLCLNPVNRFYGAITTADFKVTANNLRRAISFICVCGKHR
ncbi:MAG: class I SAM-dependent methyltransferase [Candidatus Omnitrophota bacterium]